MCTTYMGTCWYETMGHRHQILRVSGRRTGIFSPGVHHFLTTILRKLQEHCEASTRNLRREPSIFCITQRDRHNKDSSTYKRLAWGGGHLVGINSRTKLEATNWRNQKEKILFILLSFFLRAYIKT